MVGFLLILIAAAGTAFAEWEGVPPSSGTVWRLERLEESVGMSALGRRVLAESKDTVRLERRGLERGAILRYAPATGKLAVDPDRLESSREWDNELALVRESALAAFGIPVDLDQARAAAYQLELDYALSRASQDPAFDAWLWAAWRAKVLSGPNPPEGREKGRAREDDPALCRAPFGEGDRAAFYLDLFAEDPDSFYWAVECGWRGAETVRLTELQDFLAAHPPGSLSKPPAGSLYVRIKGRRYPAYLARAALAVTNGGGLSRIRESLGAYDSKPVPALQERAARWIGRHLPKPPGTK